MQRKRSCMRAQKIEDSSDARKRKTRSGEDAECVGKLRKENRSSAECRFRRSRTNEWSGRRVERVESGTRQTCLAITEKLKRWRQPLRFRGFFRNSVSRVSRLPRTASVLALPASSHLRFLSSNFSYLLLSATTHLPSPLFPSSSVVIWRFSRKTVKREERMRGATKPESTILRERS